jgi:hypothetical protein
MACALSLSCFYTSQQQRYINLLLTGRMGMMIMFVLVL